LGQGECGFVRLLRFEASGLPQFELEEQREFGFGVDDQFQFAAVFLNRQAQEAVFGFAGEAGGGSRSCGQAQEQEVFCAGPVGELPVQAQGLIFQVQRRAGPGAQAEAWGFEGFGGGTGGGGFERLPGGGRGLRRPGPGRGWRLP
jgi:hypothetical protein